MPYTCAACKKEINGIPLRYPTDDTLETILEFCSVFCLSDFWATTHYGPVTMLAQEDKPNDEVAH
jgi:hypothetical protein